MSPTKKDRKIRSVSGKDFPQAFNGSGDAFARVIADALHRDFGATHAAVKTVVSLTHANERAVKNWFLAKNGPTGQHLVDLVRTSDQVLEAVLLMSGRTDLVVAKKLADSKEVLIKMLQLIADLQSIP
jgi:pyridoxal/pyridoxine/pyridoxamine kinase